MQAYKSFLLVLLLGGGLTFFSSCGMFDSYEGGPDPDPVPQTEILRFELTPDTVATEDTVLIHCVIEDSLDESFKFDWNLEKERRGPEIKWISPNFDASTGQVEIFNRAVTVDNGSVDSIEVDETFEIPVFKK